jgi:nitric oxide reductase NorE protein
MHGPLDDGGPPRSPAAATPGQGGVKHARHLPGEEGIWVFISGDLLVFTLFFALFVYYRGQDIPLFELSHRALNRSIGLLNTTILLSSSLLVATAVTSARHGRHARAAKLLLGAIACGVAFGISKTFEYSAKFKVGIGLTTNKFFTFYFMLTGLHMIHVIFATAMLLYMWTRARGNEHGPGYVQVMEAGGVFWHMVDLLWVVLFALLYLLG